MENNQEQPAGEVRDQLHINVSPSWVSHAIWAAALVVSAHMLSTANITVSLDGRLSQAVSQQTVQKKEVLSFTKRMQELGESK